MSFRELKDKKGRVDSPEIDREKRAQIGFYLSNYNIKAVDG